MRLSPDYASFVEVGTRQYEDDPDRFRLFFEYHDHPAGAIVYEGLGRYDENQHMSVVMSPYTAGQLHMEGANTIWALRRVAGPRCQTARSGLPIAAGQSRK